MAQMLSEEEEIAHLRAIYTGAQALCTSSDPLLQGLYAHLLARVEQILQLKSPGVPRPAPTPPAG